MDTSELMLDGNALGGPLGEVFVHDMTDAMVRCGGCGGMEPVGAEHVYVHAPGVVMRCLHCDDVLLVIAGAPGRHLLGLGVGARLEVRTSE
jgi:hypothetical protein